MSVRYTVVVGKRDERVSGAEDADVTFSIALADAQTDGFDATLAFMRGRLKAVGDTGEVLDELKSGAATSAINALVAEA